MLLAQCHAGDVIARAGMARLFDESCDVASSNQASEPAKCLFKTTRESVLAVLATLLEVHNNGVILCVDDLLPAVSSWQSGGIWCHGVAYPRDREASNKPANEADAA